jgi:2-keto-4-pentenoate hydratase/2-oxohepta-3-ene-1,7-dioic acid hydratase in catechol pathway
MKLARFNGSRIGVVVADRIVDVTHLCPLDAEMWPPVAEIALIASFDTLRPALEAAAQQPGVPVADVRLEVPVRWPNKLLAYPANYHAHVEEMSSKNRADLNGFFLKAASSLSGPRDPIVLPDLAGRSVHHECELAIIIGRAGRHIPRAEALDHIFGYSCLIDVTVRGAEERVMRKSFDTFCPVGPWIVTRDEVADPNELDLLLTVNGEVRQSANTRDLIVGIEDMITLASSVLTLQPGDVIATGTPEGVGPLVDGDEVVITIESVGSMSVQVVQGQGGSNVAFENNAARLGGPS